MDYFAHNVAIVFLISQTLLLLSIAQFIEDPTDDPTCKNESIYGFRQLGRFYSGDSDAVFQDDLCSVSNDFENVLLRTDDDFITYKRIISEHNSLQCNFMSQTLIQFSIFTYRRHRSGYVVASKIFTQF